MSESPIRIERDGARAVVTVNRPEVLNALNIATLTELRRVIEELDRDDGVRVVVVTGAVGLGRSQAFVAGADIAEMAAMDDGGIQRFGELGQKVMNQVDGMEKPVIAAVNGYALGGGCELALACDLIFAAETAWFGLPEVNLGLLPGWGGTQRLPERVGMGKAKELILSGERINAAEAHRIGLADRLYPPDHLLPETLAFADLLAAKSPAAIRGAKSAIHASRGPERNDGLTREALTFVSVFATEERRAAMKAFLERKK